MKLNDDPIRAVPMRVLLASLPMIAILTGVAHLLEWPILHVLIGFSVGVIINLISFYLMVKSAKKLLNKEVGGLSAIGGNGFFGRLVLYGVGLFLMAHLSLYALLAAAIGVSMVGLVLKVGSILSINSSQ